jgi:hypothetical protein
MHPTKTLFAVGLLMAAAWFGAVPAQAAGTVPYTDPSSSGYIGLCNKTGTQITSGSVDTAPFVWRAISSVAAKSPYNSDQRTAVLYAFLPLQGFPPGEWSGKAMTAASRYSNPTAPMAAATDRDPTLEQFIEAYPPNWDGFIELRVYLGTANQPEETKHYPTLNIQVSGNTWRAVGGGAVNCASGQAVSAETILPSTTTTTTSGSAPSSTTTTSGSAPSTTTKPASSSTTPTTSAGSGRASRKVPSGSGTRGSGGVRQGGRSTKASAAPKVRTGAGDTAALVAWLVGGGVVLLGAAGLLLARHRRLRVARARPDDSDAHGI